MRGSRVALILVAATLACAPKPCERFEGPPVSDDLYFGGYRSPARDAEGSFFWIRPDRSLQLRVQATPDRVCLGGEDGAATPFESRRRHGEHEISWAPPRRDHRVDVIVDGYRAASYRLRSTATVRGPLLDFWERVDDAASAWREGRRAEAARVWASLPSHPAASEVAGEVARALSTAAFFEYREGRYATAAPLLARAHVWLGPVGGNIERADLLFHEANLAHYSGAYLTALDLDDRALALARGDALRSYGFAVQKAVTLAALGRYGEAVALLERRPAPDDLPDSWRVVTEPNEAWVRFGAMEAGILDEVDVAELRDAHLKAFETLVEMNDLPAAINQRARAIALDVQTRHFDTAQRGLTEIDALDAEVAGHAAAFVETLRARVEAARGDHASARARLLEVTRGDGPASVDRCSSFELLGEIAEQNGDVEKARGLYTNAMECIGALDEAIVRPGPHALLLQTRGGAEERLARALARAGRPEEAFRTLDRARAAVLERHVDALLADANPDAWLAYQTARRAEERVRFEGCATRVDDEARRTCKESLEPLRRATERALLEYQRRVPRRSVKVRDAAWLDEVRAALEDDRGLLAISGHGQDTLFLFLDAKGVDSSTAAAPLKTWARRIDRLRHLYVVPDWDRRAYDPFEAAPHLEMTYLPHADVLLRPESNATGPTIVIADPDRTLPLSAREGTRIAARTDARQVHRADRTAWLHALREASVLHYAGHAFGQFGDPWSVRLRLARGEELSIFDVLLEARLPRLVVLNGCTTGPTSRAGGGGFPAALVHAGVRHVIATTAVQADGAATEFFEDFYTARVTMSATEAFRRAVRRSVDRGDGTWRVMRLWGR